MQRKRMMTATAGLAVGVVVCAGVWTAGAQIGTTAGGLPDIGGQWLTVGDPGNPAYDGTGSTIPLKFNYAVDRGSVDYAFRITQTEITSATYLEFLNAYSPYMMDDRDNRGVTGEWTRYKGDDENGVPRYRLVPGRDLNVADVSWVMAARFANWLHNDMRTDRDAFFNGAYDTTAYPIVENFAGPLPLFITRNDDARFWIPNLDEYIKAMYWDANKNGEGEGGYFLYPYSADEPGPSGLPEDGAVTSAYDGFSTPILISEDIFRLRQAGQYPDSQSPWGLLDGSGTYSEMVEGGGAFTFQGADGPFIHGEGVNGPLVRDILGNDHGDIGTAAGGGATFRIATSIPAPSGAVVLVGAGVLLHRRRYDLR